MSKTIWIVNQYASTPDTGYGGRHYYLGRELAKQGHRVFVIASASHHLLRRKPDLEDSFKIEKLGENFNFVWVNLPDYGVAHSKQRVLSWFLLPWRILKLPNIILNEPDVVLCSSPSLFSFIGARRLARKFKARLIFEVRDIWPLTLTEIGGYSPWHPLLRIMQWVEDRAYRQSDLVLSNLENAVEHMVGRGMQRNKFHWIPNGFSLDEVNKKVRLNSNLADQLPRNKFVVGYAGTLGLANALENFINAAEMLKDNNDIAFVMVGGGKEKLKLQELAKSKNLNNVYFFDPIPKVEVQALLSEFDACYIGWLNDGIYRFGIGANKIPEYLYSGKPVLHAYSGYGDPISESNAGLSVPAENPKELARAILELSQMSPQERKVLGDNGRNAALGKYEYRELAKKLSRVIF